MLHNIKNYPVTPNHLLFFMSCSNEDYACYVRYVRTPVKEEEELRRKHLRRLARCPNVSLGPVATAFINGGKYADVIEITPDMDSDPDNFTDVGNSMFDFEELQMPEEDDYLFCGNFMDAYEQSLFKH